MRCLSIDAQSVSRNSTPASIHRVQIREERIMTHKTAMTADPPEQFEIITLTSGDSASTIYSLRPSVRFDGAYDDEFDYDTDEFEDEDDFEDDEDFEDDFEDEEDLEDEEFEDEEDDFEDEDFEDDEFEDDDFDYEDDTDE